MRLTKIPTPIPQRSYKEGWHDRPTPRPNIDVVREQRHSPRTREEVQLALSAIWELYHFIDGIGTKEECLERNLNFMHLLYERYLEDTISSSGLAQLSAAASRDRVHDRL